MTETIISEIQNLIQNANEAYNLGDYDTVITLCDQVLMDAKLGSADAVEAELLGRHAREHELLEQISLATEPQEILELLEEADQLSLVFDLQRLPLSEVRQRAKNAMGQMASAQLRKLAERGDLLAGEGKWLDAADFYRQASEVKLANPELIQDSSARMQEALKNEQRQRDFEDLLSQARSLQDAGKFDDALKAVQQALSFQPEQTEAVELLSALDAQRIELHRLEELVIEARRASTAGNLTDAQNRFTSALELAQKLKLNEQVIQLEQQLDQIRQQIGDRDREVQAMITKAQKVLAIGMLGEAIRQLSAAHSRAPDNNEVTLLLEKTREQEGTLNTFQRLKAEGKQETNLSLKLGKFFEANLLVPDDEELVELILAAQVQIAAEAMAATFGEVDLGFDTPEEVEDGKKDAEGRILIEGVRSIVEKVGPDKAAPIVNRYRSTFGRIATRKLSDYVMRYADPLIKQGRFVEAMEVYDDAINKWDVGWVRSPTIIWDRVVGDPIIRTIKCESLDVRLKIVGEQRLHAQEAIEVYPQIQTYQQLGDAQQTAGRFENAVQNYEEALKVISGQPNQIRRTLLGVEQSIMSSLSIVLRRWAQELSRQVLEGISEAERLNNLNQLDEAETQANRTKQNAQRVQELSLRFKQVTPEEQQSAWIADSYLEKANLTYDQVVRHEKDFHALKAGDRAFNLGDYTEAEGQYHKVTEWGKTEAMERLALIPALRSLKSGAEQDVINQDFAGILSKVGQVFEKDGRCQWAVDLERQTRPLWEARRSAETYLAQATTAIHPADGGRPNYDVALRYLDEANKILDNTGRRDAPTLEKIVKLKTEAEAGHVLRQEAITARQKMMSAFTQGKTWDDYTEITNQATIVLQDNPADGLAIDLKKRAETILALKNPDKETSFEALMQLRQWDKALEQIQKVKPAHQTSALLSDLEFEISQKQSEDLRYDALLLSAREAVSKPDWGEALIYSKRASEQRPSEAEPLNLVKESKKHLLTTIKDKLALANRLDITSLAEAEQAAQALRRAEGEDGIKDVAWLLDRARLIERAQQRIAVGDVETAETLLQDLAEKPENTGDSELQEIYRRAQFEVNLKRGKTALNPPPNFKTAVGALQICDGLQPGNAEVLRLLRQARQEYSLQQYHEFLLKGELTSARAALRELDQDAFAVKDAQELLGFIDSKMKEAGKYIEGVELEEAIKSLDAVLARQMRYPPALKLRDKVLQDALRRAQAAENRGIDLGPALMWYGLARDNGLDEVHKAGFDGVLRVNQRLEQQFADLLIRVKRGLNDPDQTEELRADLENELTIAQKSAPDKQPKTVTEYLESLHNQRVAIAEIDELQKKISEELRLAENATSYDDASPHYKEAENLLEHASSFSIYSNRTSIRELRQRLNQHKNKREVTKSTTDSYQAAITKIGSKSEYKNDLKIADITPEDITKIQDETNRRLGDALRLNREIIRLDPENQYQLRNWPDPTVRDSDSLEIEQKQLEEQKEAVNQISVKLQESIHLFQDAKSLEQHAKDSYETFTKDETLCEAVANWKIASEKYHTVVEGKNDLAIPADPIPQITRLLYLSNSLTNECRKSEQLVERDRQAAEAKLDRLTTLRINANNSLYEAENNQHAAESALGYFKQIQEENPRDSQAKNEIPRIYRLINQFKQNKRKLGYSGVGLIIILCLLGLAWVSLRPGGFFNPPTPTPTLIPTSTRTQLPTLTPTPITPTVTITPTMTATPETPTPTIPPLPQQICNVTQSGWIRENPTNNSTGLLQVRAGDEVTIKDSVQNPQGETWYKVVTNNLLKAAFIPSTICSLIP